jgi:hypothetical protein
MAGERRTIQSDAGLRRLWWAVLDLAGPYEHHLKDLRELGEAGAYAKLALEFSDAYALVRGTLPANAVAKLDRLDAALHDMSGPERAELWHPDAVTGTEWNRLRMLATNALGAIIAMGVTDSQRALVEELANIDPALNEIKRLHVEEYDELMPETLFQEVAEYFLAEVGSGRANSPVILTLLKVLDARLYTGDEHVQELIIKGFIERILGEAPEEAIERMLPPHLREAQERQRKPWADSGARRQVKGRWKRFFRALRQRLFHRR